MRRPRLNRWGHRCRRETGNCDGGRRLECPAPGPPNGPHPLATARIARPGFSVNDAMSHTATAPANAEKRYNVHRADLPLSCPTPEMALWNSHPRVYLPIENEPNGEAACPYCGSVFVLVD